MKKALLVDVDSQDGFPNLALMKRSAFLKGANWKVELQRGIGDTAPLVDKYDHAYISTIYFQNKERVAHYAAQLLHTGASLNVEIGGSGWNLSYNLPKTIEHIMPDYSLYPGIDFSMGFTSRGCVRNCKFCIVPTKEGGIRNHARIDEFLFPGHKKLVLLDNNFLASPRWKENLEFIRARKLKVNFNQGLDIRLVTKAKARALAEVKMYGWSFTAGARGMHFAFDHPRLKKRVLKGIETLVSEGIKPHWLMFYMLVGFNTTIQQDLDRFSVLRDAGVKPYVMIYNKKRDPWLRHFARWVNRKYYEWVPFEEYKDGVLDIEIKCS